MLLTIIWALNATVNTVTIFYVESDEGRTLQINCVVQLWLVTFVLGINGI